MASFNRVILMGNLTRDPQLKYLPSNTPVCEFGMAINHRWKDKEGNQREDVCFVDLACFGRGGEIINQYMAKGRSLLVEGRLKLDTWTAQDGTKRSRHSVIVENFQFVGSRGDGGGGGGGGGQSGGYGQGGAHTEQSGGYSQGGYGRPSGGARPAPQTAPPVDEPPPMDDGPPPSGDDIPF